MFSQWLRNVQDWFWITEENMEQTGGVLLFAGVTENRKEIKEEKRYSEWKR